MFFTFFRTPVSQERFEISKCAKQVKYCKFKDLQIWSIYLSDISNGFRDILKKLFLRKVCQGLGVAKTSWLGSKHVYFIWPAQAVPRVDQNRGRKCNTLTTTWIRDQRPWRSQFRLNAHGLCTASSYSVLCRVSVWPDRKYNHACLQADSSLLRDHFLSLLELLNEQMRLAEGGYRTSFFLNPRSIRIHMWIFIPCCIICWHHGLYGYPYGWPQAIGRTIYVQLFSIYR